MIMVSRRMFLKTGAASLLVVAASGAWWGGTRSPEKALAPWRDAGAGYGDPRLDALAYAVLAPNPHNRQPWKVELVGQDAFTLICDLDRRLPDTDPFDRQITVGLGCFLEIFRMAAEAQGQGVVIEPFPDGTPSERLDDRPVVRVTVTAAEAKHDPLFDAVLERRSNKEVYNTGRGVSPVLFSKLTTSAAVGGTLDRARVAELRDLSWRAHQTEMLTPRTLQESVDLMRFGKSEVEANPDGIDFSGAKFELFHKTGILTRESLSEQKSEAFRQGMDMYREKLFSAMGYLWLKSQGNERYAQLDAGRTWVRLNLQATKLGLAVHPLSQALQEYPEMSDLYSEIHEKLNVSGAERVQMFARVGYAPRVAPKPRWPLKTRLVSA